jgi:hypothetical protein
MWHLNGNKLSVETLFFSNRSTTRLTSLVSNVTVPQMSLVLHPLSEHMTNNSVVMRFAGRFFCIATTWLIMLVGENGEKPLQHNPLVSQLC